MDTNKIHIYDLELDIYKHAIYLCIANDDQIVEALTNFKSIGDNEPVVLDCNAGPISLKDIVRKDGIDQPLGHTLILPHFTYIDDLVHEVSHLSDFIFESIGEDKNEIGTETRAYLNAYLFRKIYNIYQEEGLIIMSHDSKTKSNK